MARDPVLPTLRAATFSAVCLGLGVGAHRMMSGAAIPMWSLLFGAVGVYVLARMGSGRERGLLGIGTLIAVLQVALHLLFNYAQRLAAAEAMSAYLAKKPMTRGICAPPATGMRMPGGMWMPGAGSAAGSMGTASGIASVSFASSHLSDTGMLLAHVLAAVISAWWLHRTEAAVHALARSASAWVLRFIAPPMRVVRLRILDRCATHIEPAPQQARSLCLSSSRLLRGPPRIASFA